MSRSTFALVLGGVLALGIPSFGQVIPYGTSTPPGFAGVFDTGGQIPFVNNTDFKLVLRNHPNTAGGAVILAFAPASVPISASVLLVDLAGAIIIDLPPGVTEVPIAVPNNDSMVGYTGYAQAGVIDPALLGGFGLTNAISVTVLPNKAPKRAYIPGECGGGGSQMSVLDLEVQPPVFRATGAVLILGGLPSNFASKVAVAEDAQIAFAMGNGINQYIRVFDISNDPVGVITWSLVGAIPVSGQIYTVHADLEVTEDSQYLFATSGGPGQLGYLEVYDVSQVPGNVYLPSGPIQTITLPLPAGEAIGPLNLDISPEGNRLALSTGSDLYPAVTVYDITPGAAQPLSVAFTVNLTAFPGALDPCDIHFSPDGRLILVSGGAGSFAVIDTFATPPEVLIPNGTFPPGGGYYPLFPQGSAIAVKDGSLVGVVASGGQFAQFHVIDLNETSPTFGGIVSSFTTNPGGGPSPGNISNERIYARQNIVVAIDYSFSLTGMVLDVLDLNQPIPGGFQFTRVTMPSASSLTGGYPCVPRDFDMF